MYACARCLLFFLGFNSFKIFSFFEANKTKL